MKLNKVYKYVLFPHVFDPNKLVQESIYYSITWFSSVSRQINNCIVISQLYMQNKLYTAHIITHGITKSTVFINVFTTVLW